MAAERAALLRDELEQFVGVVSSTMNPEQIILFGSLADGTTHEWSDLDVVVIMESTLPFLRRRRAVLERISPHVSMDLFVYTPSEWHELVRTRPFLCEEVADKGKVVYERPGTALAR